MRTHLRSSNNQNTTLIASGIAIAVILTSAIAMFSIAESESVPTLPGYSFRRSITVDNSQISGSADLVDYTSVLVLEDPWVKSVANGGDINHNDAWDITFTKSDGITEIPFEIEAFDPVNGKLTVWLHHDTLYASASNQYFFYYGSSASSDPSDESFWYEDYLGVWHLNDLDDSGPGGWNLSDASSSSAEGLLGSARDNTSSSYMDAGNVTTINDADSLTGSIWVKVDNLNADGAMMAKGSWGASAPVLFWRDDKGAVSGRANTFSILLNANSGGVKRIEGSAGQSNDNDWHYIVFTYAAGQSDGLRLYIDGVEDAQSPEDVSSMTGIKTSTDAFRIGRSLSNGSFDGMLDEARMSAVVRSADWIATEYNNQSDAAGFWTVADEEELSSGLPVTWSGIQAEWIGGRDVEITWSTANELNNEYFVIERSLEGTSFETVGEVPSKGDSEHEQEYIFHDLKPNHFSGTHILYRVRQIDYNGQASVSKAVEVEINEINNLALEVYPNPFTDVVRVQIPETTERGFRITLRNPNGGLITEERLSASTAGEIVTWYPPSHIPSGSYVMELISDSNRKYAKVMIHQ